MLTGGCVNDSRRRQAALTRPGYYTVVFTWSLPFWAHLCYVEWGSRHTMLVRYQRPLLHSANRGRRSEAGGGTSSCLSPCCLRGHHHGNALLPRRGHCFLCLHWIQLTVAEDRHTRLFRRGLDLRLRGSPLSSGTQVPSAWGSPLRGLSCRLLAPLVPNSQVNKSQVSPSFRPTSSNFYFPNNLASSIPPPTFTYLIPS